MLEPFHLVDVVADPVFADHQHASVDKAELAVVVNRVVQLVQELAQPGVRRREAARKHHLFVVVGAVAPPADLHRGEFIIEFDHFSSFLSARGGRCAGDGFIIAQNVDFGNAVPLRKIAVPLHRKKFCTILIFRLTFPLPERL